MKVLEKFESINRQIELIKQRQAEREGARSTILSQARQQFGIRTENKISKVLAKDRSKLERLSAELDADVEKFWNKWQKKLEGYNAT